MDIGGVQYIFLKNRAADDQAIHYKGNRIVMKGRAEEAFPPDIARVFVEQCHGIVVELPTNLGVRAEFQRPETTFIANWSGNPDAEPTRKAKRFNKDLKVWQLVDEANPFYSPQFIFREIGGTQSQTMSLAGQEMTFNHPKTCLEFPPYQIRELPKQKADMILSQEALVPDNLRGLLREVPAPSTFQPDMSWPLDDMRDYMGWMDPLGKKGVNQATLERKYGKNKITLETNVLKAKRELMQRLFFRIYDKKFHRPTKGELDEAKGQGQNDEPVEDEAMKQLQKTQEVQDAA